MSNFEYYRNLVLSVACLLLGILLGLTHLFQENGGFPHEDELIEMSGYVTWVESYDYGIRFGIDETSLSFDYMSKMDAQGLIYNSLVNSDGQQITILYRDTDPTSPIYSDTVYFNVFQLAIDGEMIRSLSESEKAWRSDNFLAPFLILFFIFGAFYVARKTLRSRKNA